MNYIIFLRYALKYFPSQNEFEPRNTLSSFNKNLMVILDVQTKSPINLHIKLKTLQIARKLTIDRQWPRKHVDSVVRR